MVSVTAGLVGGFVATVVMTAVMMAIGDGGPPPTAAFIAKFAGGEPADHKMPGMVLHLLYGAVAGAVFVLIVPALGLSLGSLGVAVGLGVVYAIVLMIAGMVVWLRAVIGMEPDKGMMMTFATVHVVYGLVLGAFLGAGLMA